MCLNPLHKRNNYFGAQAIEHKIMHDTEHMYLNLPCGHCADCIAVKQSSWIQRMTEEAKYNHVFFATLTYDNKHLPCLTIEKSLADSRTKAAEAPQAPEMVDMSDLFDEEGKLVPGAYDTLTTLGLVHRGEPDVTDFMSDDLGVAPSLRAATDEKGVIRLERTFDIEDPLKTQYTSFEDAPKGKHLINIRYADIHHLQLMFKRMRDNNQLGRNFRYIAVSERGKKGARPHFHILFLVPRRPGDDSCDIANLEAALKDMLLQFWSTNVGTRKHPVYERNFTYRQRWIGRKLYRNFDCHYVQPNLTTDGVANVAYYVTKYIFKESPREEELRKLLFANLVHTDSTGVRDLTDFRLIWDIVKSRMVCSKGLGIDGIMETVETVKYEPLSVPEYAEQYAARDRAVCLSSDLPGDDYELTAVPRFRILTQKRRIVVPNFDLIQHLKDNALREKEKGICIYVKYNGEHVTLARYYQDRILSEFDRLDLYYSWDQQKYPDKHDRVASDEERHRKESRLARSRAQAESHGDMDGNMEEVETLGQNIDPYSNYRSVIKLHTLTSKRIML